MSFENPDNIPGPDGVGVGAANVFTATQTFQDVAVSEGYNIYVYDADNDRGVLDFLSGDFKIDTEIGTGGIPNLRLCRGGSLRLYMGANGAVNCAVSFFPNSSNAVDLGASSLKWRDAHIGRDIYATGLPTSDPAVAGKVWNDSGTLKVSAG